MRSDCLAKKLKNNNDKDLWKETGKMNNNKTSLTTTIDGVSAVK